MLSVLIVDDEAPARHYLRRLLETTPEVCVVAEAATVEQAKQLAHETRPDAVFLDVMLTGATGFDLLEDMAPVHAPAVVFVSAHDNHAAQAFDVEATDYLLKPVSPERLAKTVARLLPRANGLDLRTTSGKHFLKVQDLTIAQAQGDYVRLCGAMHASELAHMTLKSLAAQLPSPPFYSLSRSLIINLDHISHTSQLPSAQVEVVFSNGVDPLVLGRTASRRLRRIIAGAHQNGTTTFNVAL